ncbi:MULTISPECIES: 3'(2'),5'-bisphosphate nucleotidase CysQ [Alphaproteobacteria]|uniref:3'(2'),5'-bisphosphate nucleotidase CysQ n=2 Tax=Alphaproteobacteria TaxID=28211 RepID=A0A512HI23_9HYPH|nr:MULTISPECIES: 3'(2'),5'-bisphosphate nucleotidase CysQ [Alphaproteobacteria]GEO85098.1 3'(2'),5'-bisphosphate nucleotidase CysQ [Ciceribacter naphthalenivorans]GLR24568.1 3'(2'),5'-bisphosphate nucleotidase CysQ [Ciceribacter naphthalenivorans]GLT07424.1 3'(2'),5'-bisphosphate nucleotidase CysQ [Sphingomonas psychrolutea]
MTGTTSFDWQADMALITTAAREAGTVALSYFGQSPEVWWKNEGHSPVSAADYAANRCLEEQLRKARPDYGWLSEETDDDPARLDCETLFIVDPIDGTRAFINNRKTWCVSVAVVHQGKPVAGVLVAPALDEEFTAYSDGPALKNGQPITVAPHRPDDRLRVATPQDIVSAFDAQIRTRIERVEHIPSLAYRLAMVAEGRIDATLVKRNSHDWDLAAADLILKRAGGSLVDLAGAPLCYNRADVSHGELCAAIDAELPDLLKHLLLLPHG